MTDFNNPYNKEKKTPRKEKFFKERKIHSSNEKENLISKNIESDSLLKKHSEYTKQIRPNIKSKSPNTFCFFGSAQQYYKDTIYNIINYYPFDGTKEELLDWHLSSSFLDGALLKQYWPKTVGHLSLDYDGFVQFYSGPNKIQEFSTVSKFTHLDDPAIVIDPKKGNTIEFWLKKDAFNLSYEKETVVDIGSYPGKVSSDKSAQLKVYLSASSGSPFRFTYLTGLSGSSDIQIGSSQVTTASVADSKWHHYAISLSHTGSTLTANFYVDGVFNSTTTTVAEDLFKVSTFLGGTLGSNQETLSGSLSASIDDFRFWKGIRDAKEVGTYYDKKVYASNAKQKEYTNRLGIFYKFNEDPVLNNNIDRIVIDYSGNDITGIIKNYEPSYRVITSAITLSEETSNEEVPEPVINEYSSQVQALRQELDEIGRSYDLENSNLLKNFIPHWASEDFGKEISSENQFQILLHLLATEFDEIKTSLDTVRYLNSQDFDDPSQNPDAQQTSDANVVTYEYSTPTSNQPQIDYSHALSNANRGWFPLAKLKDINLDIDPPFLKAATLNEKVNGHIDLEQVTKGVEECSQHILQRMENKVTSFLKTKGTARGLRAMYNAACIDNVLVTDLIIPYNGNLFLEDSKVELGIEKVKSINFEENNEATLHLFSSEDYQKSYIPASSEYSEYTFEGTFIFPTIKPQENAILESSVFGLSSVAPVNNNLTELSPNNSDIAVKVVKNSRTSKSSKFVLYSPSGLFDQIETSNINNVYDNSRWNLSIRVKNNSSEPFVNMGDNNYSIVFSGYNYLIDNKVNHFSHTASLSSSVYQNFTSSNKTVFIGAKRTNITGAVELRSDHRVVNFSAFSDCLSDEELELRARAPSLSGRNINFLRNLTSNTDNETQDTTILNTQFDLVDDLSKVNPFSVSDSTAGSLDKQRKYGDLIGSAYNFKSIGFSNELDRVVKLEYIEEARNVPIESAHALDGISIKKNDIERFSLSTRPETNIFSFEKSANQATSREMLKFLSGVRSLNNLVGEPVNKYRKNYKLLNFMRQKFFDGVKNENQFERFLNYYRWIDSAIGTFFEQIIPASSIANTGLENVVESHVLERNKYQHQFNNFKAKYPDIETNILGINELLYDWEHGHATGSEDDHCLWQKDRKEVESTRKEIRRALTTVITGSNYNYVLRNLSRPYKFTSDVQRTYNIGHNRNANKIENLYKIVETGKTIEIKSDDIYEFKKCNDVIDPNKEKIYTAKTNTTNTLGYLDADADLILPFSLYSSSAGTDFEDFKKNLKITNNLSVSKTMESHWVNTLLKSRTHRDNPIGQTSEERLEAYHILHDTGSLRIVSSNSSAPRLFSKLSPSRIHHIANKKTTTSPLVIGNYLKDYEIVQTSGRTNNNNYLVEREGENLTGSYTASPYLSGTVDFLVPTRPARDHVFVNKFSSPGSPEASSPYGQNRESLEFSIYNTLNYRNLSVRGPLNDLSRERSEKFGFRSGSSTQASFHKINRNFTRRTGSSGEIIVADNAFTTRPIPSHDFGYSWITASAKHGVYEFLNKNSNVPYQFKFCPSGSFKSSQTITFLNTSELNSSLDFVGLNTFTTRSLSSDVNMLMNSSTDLNSIILNRQGPHGWPSWKQIRGQDHPVVRLHRENNIMSFSKRGEEYSVPHLMDYEFDYSRTSYSSQNRKNARIVENHKEIMASCKFNPITATKHRVNSIELSRVIYTSENYNQKSMRALWMLDEYVHELYSRVFERSGLIEIAPSIAVRASAANTITGFANQKMSDKIGFEEVEFSRAKNIPIIEGHLTMENENVELLELNYLETIYPREINTYTKHARTRENFNFFGWKSKRSDRNLKLDNNIQYSNFLINKSNKKYFPTKTVSTKEQFFKKSFFNSYEIVDLNSTGSGASISASNNITSSAWVLDSRRDLTILPLNLTSSFFTDGDTFLQKRDQGTRGEGILQNDFSIFAMGFNGIRGSVPFAPLYNRRIPQTYGQDVYLSGESKWEAPTGQKIGPFYDEYETFREEIKLVGQEYSLIPEFTISKYIQDIYEKDQINNAKVGPDFLNLTGAIYHESSDEVSIGSQFFKTYSNSDFLKYFADLEEVVEATDTPVKPAKLTLRCSAVKRLLPYRGFYPAERAVQLTEIFNENYLKEGSFSEQYIEDAHLTEDQAKSSLRIKIQNNKTQVSKPLFSPGVLFNSIKAGLAVDYPIFSSSVSGAVNYFNSQSFPEPISGYGVLNLSEDTCFTGSAINETVDGGIPRIKGKVAKRVSFEDLLSPERLIGLTIHDNEPHPSASSLYGDRDFLKVTEHPAKFGSLDVRDTVIYNGIKFNSTQAAVVKSLRPYRSAINNFASQTVKFFLKDGKLQHAISRASKPVLNKDVQYSMRVYVTNADTVMYDRHSAFGPPVDEGDVQKTKFEKSLTSQTGSSATGSVTFVTNQTIDNGIHIYPQFVYNYTASCDYDMNIIPISTTGAYNSYSNLSGTYWQVSGANHNAKACYYDSRCFTGSVIRMEFQDPSAISPTLSLELIASGTVNPSTPDGDGIYLEPSENGLMMAFGTRILNEHIAVRSVVGLSNAFHVPFGIFDSYTSPSETVSAMTKPSYLSLINGADAVEHNYYYTTGSVATLITGGMPYIDVRTTRGGLTFKTAEQMAESVAGLFSSGSTWTTGLNQAALKVYRSGSTVSFFANYNNVQYPSDYINFHTGSHWDWIGNQTSVTSSLAFGDFSTSGTGKIARVTTSSANDWGAIPYEISLNSSGHNHEQLTASLEDASDSDVNSGISEVYERFINLADASWNSIPAGTNLSKATWDKMSKLFDSKTELKLSASFSSPPVDGLDIYRLDTGSDGNVAMIDGGITSKAWCDNIQGLAGGTDSNTYMSLQASQYIQSSSHGHLPYVPPFLDPGTRPYAEISFTPTETKEHTIPEIIDGMTVTYYNMPEPSNKDNNTNYKEAMVLSASIDFNDYILLMEDAFAYSAGTSRSPGQSDFARWIIRPKWETPVHDFKMSNISALNLSTGQVETVSGSSDLLTASPWKTRYQTSYYEALSTSSVPYMTASRGMWHQLGTSSVGVPGYYLNIESGPTNGNTTDDLAAKCGFVTSQPALPTGVSTYSSPGETHLIKLGQLADSKLISEAVVAIPYYLGEDCKMKLLKMKSRIYDLAKEMNNFERSKYIQKFIMARTLEEKESLKEKYEEYRENNGLTSEENAAYQLRMMKKYIMPPQFDFVLNKDMDPFVAYIFQFKATLNKEDLSKIWQNLYPDPTRGISIAQHSKVNENWITTDTEFLASVLDSDLDPASIKKDSDSIYENPEVFSEQQIRWLVFKIKYRAESDYQQVVQQSVTDVEENVIGFSGTSIVGARDTRLFRESRKDSLLFSKFSYNWPYDFFSMVEMIKLEAKMDLFSNPHLSEADSEFETVQQRMEQGEQDPVEVMSYQVVDASAGTGTGTTSSADLSNLIIRQVLKQDTDAVPSPANILTIATDAGYGVKSGSESIYINGLLQSVGTSNDYTISGTTITFNFNIQSGDSVVVTYIRERS